MTAGANVHPSAATAPVSLASHTTFRIGGDAREFYTPASLSELRQLLGILAREGKDPFFLGKGANTLFPDGEYSRPVISTSRLRGVSVDGRCIRADAGVSLGGLIGLSVRQGLSGLEGLIGIPASIGGAVMMNAGGRHGEVASRVARLGLLPVDGGALVEVDGDEVPWRYRNAGIRDHVVAWAELELVRSHPSDIRESMQQCLSAKWSSQPLAAHSAGCVFRNPPGDSAGRLIEELCLKGERRGAACVSPRHANFIVNDDGSASASDVVELLEAVRERVQRSRGVSLNTEIVFA